MDGKFSKIIEFLPLSCYAIYRNFYLGCKMVASSGKTDNSREPEEENSANSSIHPPTFIFAGYGRPAPVGYLFTDHLKRCRFKATKSSHYLFSSSFFLWHRDCLAIRCCRSADELKSFRGAVARKKMTRPINLTGAGPLAIRSEGK